MPPRSRKVAPAEAVDRFDRFRRRAAETKTKPKPDFVLGAADGFDPEVRVSFPLSLKQQEAFYYASRENDVFAQMRIILGDEQYERIRNMFDREADSTDLMAGLAAILIEHVVGKGGADVPGGPRGS